MKTSLTMILFLVFSVSIFPQADTTKYAWPINPMTLQREITGTFGEYRSTSVEGHYHNGTDIPGAANTPVLNLKPGTVAVAYHDGSTGYDSYVRITSVINGQTKNITYYHCIPTVSEGQVVAIGQQIAKIAIDHIHLIEYRYGGTLTNKQINAIRPDGGLTPYTDYKKPNIRTIKFLLDNSNVGVNAGALGNKIDITVHVEEVNGTSSSASNNGTYEIGYKILSEDRQTVVFNPLDDGSRFKYYNIPQNSYVNVNYYKPESSTSKHVYIITNGNGATNVASSQVVTNNFWDVTQYPYGKYTLMVFSKDTRGNGDTVYVNITTTSLDLIAPEQANLKYVKQDQPGYFTIAWNKPSDEDLKGYRLFYSQTGASYSLKDNENVLTKDITEMQYQYNLQNPLYLKINAVDTSSMVNLSLESDTYGLRMKNDDKKILIVDGFNRYNGGSWIKQYHNFVLKYSEAFSFSYDCSHNSQIENGAINLSNYEVVFWMLGDESVDDITFSDAEKTKVSEYLDNGGKMFISGSEIAYDLGGVEQSTQEDSVFLSDYLKSKFVADNAGIKSIHGVSGTAFSTIDLDFGNTVTGSPYNEYYPDVIEPVNGGQQVLVYDNNLTAAVTYSGSFANPNKTGQMMYMAFPFETIGNLDMRKSLMTSIFTYFGLITDIDDTEIPVVYNYNLAQNYPNPFNPTTTINYQLPVNSKVSIKVFDVLGREVATLIDAYQNMGSYSVTFDATQLSSGVYIYQINAGEFIQAKKMTILK